MDPHILLRDGAQAVENIPQKVKQSYHISQEFHMWVHQFSCSVQSDSLRPHESQQARPKRNENIHPYTNLYMFTAAFNSPQRETIQIPK